MLQRWTKLALIAGAALCGGPLLTRAAPPAAPNSAVVAYESHYEEKANLAHWSKGKVAAGERMLGPYEEETNSLTLDALPKHAFLRLEVELVLMGSWDGNFRSASQITIALSDRRILMASSFASNSVVHLTPSQSYPDNIDGGTFQEAYGIVARNVDWAPRPAVANNQSNGVLKLDFTFPHGSEALRIDFTGSRLRNGTWGLGKVRVSALPGPPVKLALADVQRLVGDLDSAEEVRIDRATWRLIAAGEAAVPLIRAVLAGEAEADGNYLGKLIAQLDHEIYATRDVAQKALLHEGMPALAACRQALRRAITAEKRARLTAIVEELTTRPRGLLDLRLQRVLGTIGSKEALEVADSYLSYAKLPELTTLRTMLRMDLDERWKEVEPRLSHVVGLLNDPGIQGMKSREVQTRNLRPEVQRLKELATDEGAAAGQIAAALAVARKAYGAQAAGEEPALLQLEAARKVLARSLTTRQEAMAVTLGLLD